jgi:amidase
MSSSPKYTDISVDQSGAFVESFSLPPTGDGPLAGLTFAVKDLFDVAGHATGCGNPSWHRTHPPAVVHAVCVEQLLAAGARCFGKTVTDELAFSLIGENHFYGTPLNPAAPDRVPGGSSSGSASAVACGLVDFAIGTDTGGSVRVPASNCGLWGLRPSHDTISVAGVMPFAPCFDTVGLFARSAEVLQEVAGVLLATDAWLASEPSRILLVDDVFELVDADVRAALAEPIQRLRDQSGWRVESIGIEALTGKPGAEGFALLLDLYCVLQWAEIKSSLGAWISETRPEFGPVTARSFELAHGLDRRRIGPAIYQRSALCQRLSGLLGPNDLLCYPTTPGSAPAKKSADQDRRGEYYRRALAMTAIAGLGRLPQVVMPGARTPASPVGLSLVAAHGQDMLLLAAASHLAEAAFV